MKNYPQAYKFAVMLDGDRFWLDCEEDGKPYQTEMDVNLLDSLASGFIWGYSHKAAKHRKFRTNSAAARSITALLPSIGDKLLQGEQVIAFTPDVLIEFYT